jgi:hypothetical protein
LLVPGKPLQPNLMFASKAKAYPSKYHSGDPLKGKHLALPTNIILDWNSMPGTSTIAYWTIHYLRRKLSVVKTEPGGNLR